MVLGSFPPGGVLERSPLGSPGQESRIGGSEVEDGDVEKVAQAFRLVQVVYVVVVAGRRRQTKERREDWEETDRK